MIKNESCAVGVPMPMGASEVIASKSGRFVTNDGSGRMELADDGDALLAGWVELPEGAFYNSSDIYTCSSTEGADVALFYPAEALLGVVFRIPNDSNVTFTTAMRGKTCDLVRSSNVQGAKLDASGEDNLLIVDGDLTSAYAWVDVMINSSKLTGRTGVV